MRNLQAGGVALLFTGLIISSACAQAPTSPGDLTGHWRLFVDDEWIADRTHVDRVYHAFNKHAG
jgi:hypothetical protein